MTTTNFYKNLVPRTSFSEVLQSRHHQAVPADWYVAITDVINSTQAIETGRYKDVNIAGGLAAMAISNVNEDMGFPFVFGGDGMTCLIPPSIKNDVNDVLYDTSLKVKTFFDLELRVGLVPVQKIYEAGHQLSISKLGVSKFYNQAIISGDGVQYAEDLLKKIAAAENPFLIRSKNNVNLEADFTGFTCRWQDIPSHKGETISTIILLRDDDKQLLPDVLNEMYRIFGKEEDFHPVISGLKLAGADYYLGKEATVFAQQRTGWNYRLKLWRIKMEYLITLLAMKLHLPIKVNWYQLNKLKDYQIAASDFKKFDGSLKLVLNCQTAARKEWGAYLEDLRQKEKVYYGIHISDRAIMTCLLHSGSEQEVHFIDGADGGYALAAKMMKGQMSSGR